MAASSGLPAIKKINNEMITIGLSSNLKSIKSDKHVNKKTNMLNGRRLMT